MLSFSSLHRVVTIVAQVSSVAPGPLVMNVVILFMLSCSSVPGASFSQEHCCTSLEDSHQKTSTDANSRLPKNQV